MGNRWGNWLEDRARSFSSPCCKLEMTCSLDLDRLFLAATSTPLPFPGSQVDEIQRFLIKIKPPVSIKNFIASQVSSIESTSSNLGRTRMQHLSKLQAHGFLECK